MKNFLMIMSTPFWTLNYNENINISIFSKTDLVVLQEDCKKFAELTVKAVEAGEAGAEEYRFKRSLPLSGSQKDDYEVQYVVEEHEEVQKDAAGTEAAVVVDTDSLHEFSFAVVPGSFLEVSRKMGLGAPSVALQRRGGEAVMKIQSRDLVCDLLNKKAGLSGKAQLRVGPTSEAILQLNRELTRIGDTLTEVKAMPKSNQVRAAILGFRLKGEEIAMVFEKLLQKNSLEPNDIWQEFAGHPFVDFEKSKLADFAKVNLTLETP